jgi:hypothetical protein
MRFPIYSDALLEFFPDRRIQDWLKKRPHQTAIRSARQNRYWYGVVVQTVNEIWTREARRETPYPKGAVHGALVGAFGGDWVETPLEIVRPSSAELTVAEFSQMIDAVAGWLKDEYKVILPSPEEWMEHA